MATTKSNITIAIESKLLKKAHSLAVRRGRSVSFLLAEKLHDLVAEDTAYESARLNAQSLLKSGFSLKGAKMIDKDATHGRRSVR